MDMYQSIKAHKRSMGFNFAGNLEQIKIPEENAKTLQDDPQELTKPERLFQCIRRGQNRIWSLWNIRFTLFNDPIVPLTVNIPAPTVDRNPPSGDDSAPSPEPTFPAPANSR